MLLWLAIAELGREGRGGAAEGGGCRGGRDKGAPCLPGWAIVGRVPSSVDRQAALLRAVSQEGRFLGPLSPSFRSLWSCGRGWRHLLLVPISDRPPGHGHRDPGMWWDSARRCTCFPLLATPSVHTGGFSVWPEGLWGVTSHSPFPGSRSSGIHVTLSRWCPSPPLGPSAPRPGPCSSGRAAGRLA